ncbi:5-oxoprolinase subunit PxpB [Neptunicella sp. SCSIO 80796]|uniref:5-oxoprolinase subunit PxpB n=1 Tax=Neptunicella plasticusilytica TaxID=3117012 RepID=UPI003A4E629F
MQINVAGENAVIIYFAEHPSEQVVAQISVAKQLIESALDAVVIDLVPSYTSLMVVYDQQSVGIVSITDKLSKLLEQVQSATELTGKTITLPVYYGAEVAEDLQRMAELTELEPQQIIDLHQQPLYSVYAIGFAPGFAYLGMVDKKIAVPRLGTPRLKVPKGAVAIADRQTAVYPATSPGGWNIIGRCAVAMFDPDSSPNMPVSVGDKVQFEAVSKSLFLKSGGHL